MIRRIVAAVALPVVLIALWWLLTANSTSYFWPPLADILKVLPDTWFGERARTDIAPSIARLLIGYLCALVIGVAAGVAIGISPVLRALTEPSLEFFRAIPPPVLVPVIALFAGYTGSLSKVITIALGCLWPILLNTVEGVRGVDEVLLDTARSYRLPRHSVILPAAGPQIAAGARQALSIAVILMVISELFGASNGIGASVVQFQRSFAVPQMWTGIIVLGLLGVLLSLIFRVAEHRALAWYRGWRDAERASR
ncbi:ABC transporter permease [Kineosporia babensis]|uniref:ABC transporter permease subunit n=1 Tax=Kineosporia babensis TaxID=499548 RepID=A0A9X1SXY3_9ACTN|nr:ABC transporter permease subunit [Kineosporia babensis]MCD5316481.1 ABC transporter permease subunit [Kineosporia babensis]